MAKRAQAPKQKPALRVVSKPPKDQPPLVEVPPNAADLETFHYHVGCITRAKGNVELARKLLKNERRRASDSGINLGDLDLVLRMREEEPETVQATIKRIATYAGWMGLAPGFQGDLFTAADDKADQEKGAENEGYREGIEGISAVGERYDAASIIGQARLRGWSAGQKVLQDRFLAKQAPVPEGATVQ